MHSNLQLEKAPFGDFLSRVPYTSAGGNDKNSLWGRADIAKKGVVCQEEKMQDMVCFLKASWDVGGETIGHSLSR